MIRPTPPCAPARIAAVLLNWRSPQMTLEAVRHAFAQTRPPDHVFVVDNGSADGSAEVLRHGLAAQRDRVTLLENDRNLGFGGGCNAALRAIVADDYAFAWLLNNDAEPEPACLAALQAMAAVTPSVGAVGSLMVDPQAGAADHFGTWLHPVLLTTHPVRDARDLARHRYSWLTAASLLLSVAALRDIGFFDERYFMYWEDADLNMRLRARGYTLAAAPGARVVHEAGTSSRGVAAQRYVWHFTSQRLWLRSHHRFAGAMTLWLRAKYLLKAAIDRDVKRSIALLHS